jgi:hypothetical protein
MKKKKLYNKTNLLFLWNKPCKMDGFEILITIKLEIGNMFSNFIIK